MIPQEAATSGYTQVTFHGVLAVFLTDSGHGGSGVRCRGTAGVLVYRNYVDRNACGNVRAA